MPFVPTSRSCHALRFNGHFSAGCPLILLLHVFLDCASLWDRPKLSMSFLTQSHQVFFGRPLCLIPSTSHVIQRLTQSLSSFRSTCPNNLNLLFLVIKLTGLNHKFSEYFTLLSVIQPNSSNPSNHTYFSAIQFQFMLYFYRPGYTAMQSTTHTSSVYVNFQ